MISIDELCPPKSDDTSANVVNDDKFKSDLLDALKSVVRQDEAPEQEEHEQEEQMEQEQEQEEND